MKIEVNVDRKRFFIIGGFLLIVLSLLVFVIATDYNSPIPNPGHGGSDILVIGSDENEWTLQEAIDVEEIIGPPGATGATGNTGSDGSGSQVCRMCKSCGSSWSEEGGRFLNLAGQPAAYGYACGGSLGTANMNIYLCCKP